MKALRTAFLVSIFVLTACGSLEKKTALISAGDSKHDVLDALGPPDDRQMKGPLEAWQYCQTGAGFGWHDYRVVWFESDRVTGLNSYKDNTPATSCMANMREIQWEDAPDATVELRSR